MCLCRANEFSVTRITTPLALSSREERAAYRRAVPREPCFDMLYASLLNTIGLPGPENRTNKKCLYALRTRGLCDPRVLSQDDLGESDSTIPLLARD